MKTREVSHPTPDAARGGVKSGRATLCVMLGTIDRGAFVNQLLGSDAHHASGITHEEVAV
jgi:hypothetical protein